MAAVRSVRRQDPSCLCWFAQRQRQLVEAGGGLVAMLGCSRTGWRWRRTISAMRRSRDACLRLQAARLVPQISDTSLAVPSITASIKTNSSPQCQLVSAAAASPLARTRRWPRRRRSRRAACRTTRSSSRYCIHPEHRPSAPTPCEHLDWRQCSTRHRSGRARGRRYPTHARR